MRQMEHLFQTGHWLLWLYIIAILPFRLYDFFKSKRRRFGDYLRMAFLLLVFGGYAIGFLFYPDFAGKSLLPGSGVFWLLVLIAFLQSVYECSRNRTKRNFVFCTLLAVCILICLFQRQL